MCHDTSSVQHLVLDEADKLLEMGFMEQVDEIIAACTNQSVQRSLWSATMPPVVEELARTFLRDPVHLTVGAHNAATTTIKQRLEFVGREEGKLLMLRQMILQVIFLLIHYYSTSQHFLTIAFILGHQASSSNIRSVKGPC